MSKSQGEFPSPKKLCRALHSGQLIIFKTGRGKDLMNRRKMTNLKQKCWLSHLLWSLTKARICPGHELEWGYGDLCRNAKSALLVRKVPPCLSAVMQQVQAGDTRSQEESMLQKWWQCLTKFCIESSIELSAPSINAFVSNACFKYLYW